MPRQLDLGKQQLWLERAQRWQRSQLTIRAFCARHHFSEPSFYSWKRILTERGLLPAVVGDATPEGAATPLFVAATVADAASALEPLELVLPDGLTVRVTAGFDAVALRRLLALLRGQPC